MILPSETVAVGIRVLIMASFFASAAVGVICFVLGCLYTERRNRKGSDRV